MSKIDALLTTLKQQVALLAESAAEYRRLTRCPVCESLVLRHFEAYEGLKRQVDLLARMEVRTGPVFDDAVDETQEVLHSQTLAERDYLFHCHEEHGLELPPLVRDAYDATKRLRR